MAGGGWGAASHAQEHAGDSPVWGAYTFERMHGVMVDLMDHLIAATEAFLAGNAPAVTRETGAIADRLAEAGTELKAAPDDERELWRAFWQVSKAARQSQQAAAQGRYGAAHTQFQRMVNRCISCHQARRVYGRFPEAAPAAPTADTGRIVP